MDNFRDNCGYEKRVPTEFEYYDLRLGDLDSHVYEFNRGCDDGQRAFIDFIMKKVLSSAEWERLKFERDFGKFCAQWQTYEMYADDPTRRPCDQFDPIWSDGGDEDDESYDWPFCSNCYKRAEQHCDCGDCERGRVHLEHHLRQGWIVRADH
jgi:hypothetical protein